MIEGTTGTTATMSLTTLTTMIGGGRRTGGEIRSQEEGDIMTGQ